MGASHIDLPNPRGGKTEGELCGPSPEDQDWRRVESQFKGVWVCGCVGVCVCVVAVCVCVCCSSLRVCVCVHICQDGYHQKRSTNNMLVRIWREGNPYEMLVGM